MQTVTLHLERPLLAVRLKSEESNPSDDHWPGYDENSHRKLLALQQIDALLAQINSTVAQHRVQQSNALNQLRETTVHLAVAIARGIVKQSVAQSADRLTALIQEVLNKSESNESLTVRLNPEDVKRMSEEAPEPLTFDGELTMVPDPTIAVGNCQVDSGPVTLIADYEQTLGEIESRLLEAMPSV